MGKKTIKLKKYFDVVNEMVAAATITPGSLVELTSAGEVQDQSSAGATAAASMVALEDELQGKTIEGDYASGDQVQVWYVLPGEEALVIVDSGFSPSVGDFLEADGAGGLQAYSTGEALFQVIGAKQIDDSSNHRVPVRRI